jgi:hypothetical protein
MDGPNAGNVESMVVAEVVETDDPDDDPDDEEAMYDDSPEYVHDAALDWLYEHAHEYDDEDEAWKACKDALAAEGYHIYENKECEWAVEEAFEDFDGFKAWN